jgi:hypothetical protein
MPNYHDPSSMQNHGQENMKYPAHPQMYQYGYMPPQYHGGYQPIPNPEYLEHRRISMPTTHYPSNNDQRYFGEQPMMPQYRSNSVTDAMYFNTYNQQNQQNQENMKQTTSAPPPGLQK